MMQTEYYLSLILDSEEHFGRVSSAITPLPGYPNFYRSLRTQFWEWKRHLRQNRAVARPMLITALIGLSQQLERIESELESIERAYTKQEDEQQKGELIGLASSLLQAKDGLFADWPWAMILYKPVEQGGETRPLKEHLLTLLKDFEANTDSDPEKSFDRLERETRPLLEQVSHEALKHISHTIHLYRTHPQKLLAHNLVREQTRAFLEELQDHKALEVLRHLTGETEEIEEGLSPLDLAFVTGAVGICYFGGRLLALPIALAVAASNTLGDLSSKELLWKGAIFGLNNLSQYEMADSTSLVFKIVREFSIVGASVFSCTTPQGHDRPQSTPGKVPTLHPAGNGYASQKYFKF